LREGRARRSSGMSHFHRVPDVRPPPDLLLQTC
jgi:hypothetical protein